MPRRTIKMADLFCGCGGTSTGFAHAAAERGHKVELVAVNHWELVEPSGGSLRYDILFRMLEPDELKQGMGFDPTYKITGNREEQVKQIGNAVEVNQAKALGLSMLDIAAA